MTMKDRAIVAQYSRERQHYADLKLLAVSRVRQLLDSADIRISSVESRQKTEDSLKGKLVRYGDQFQTLEDLYDLVGIRIICCFHDDVDRIGELIEQHFVVDRRRSSDKRALLDPNAFGYLSLHYVCTLPEDSGCPRELLGRSFEIQIRTILQHAWAAIEHDLGYKSQFGIPVTERRAFARIAGLLELADHEFVRTRDNIRDYILDTRQRILRDEAGELHLDRISLDEYMRHSPQMTRFLRRLAAIEGAEIDQSDPETMVPQLEWLGIRTIGQLQQLLQTCEEAAFAMADKQLRGTELDILSSNAALRYLCRARLAAGEYTQAQICDFLSITIKDPSRVQRQARLLLRERENG